MAKVVTPEPLTRADVWEWGFAAWAVVLPAAAYWVVRALNRFVEKFDAYVIAMERRVTIIETRQRAVMKHLELDD